MVCDLLLILETNALFVSGQRIAYWFLRRPTNKAGFFIELFMPRKNTDSYWFKFYPDKYLGGTAGFSFDMHGAYIIMLIQQWESGPFSAELAIKKTGKLWDKISFKFEKTEAGYVNIRMAEESSHKREIAEIRRKAVLSRYKCTTNEGTNVLQSVSDSVSVSDSSSVFNSSLNIKKEKNIKKEDIINIYNFYPKKVGYGAALKEIEKAIKKITPEELLEKVKIYSESVKNKEKQYIPNPSTWFHQERWKDCIESESHRHITPQVAL